LNLEEQLNDLRQQAEVLEKRLAREQAQIDYATSQLSTLGEDLAKSFNVSSLAEARAELTRRSKEITALIDEVRKLLA
jgi:ABC-type transporter Mla subunit MlaD